MVLSFIIKRTEIQLFTKRGNLVLRRLKDHFHYHAGYLVKVIINLKCKQALQN